MRIVDFTKPRRESRMRHVAEREHFEYIPISDPHNVPDGDYYLVPSSWWYKGKDKGAIECANSFRGRVVMVDYAKEMEQKRKNKGGLRADYIAMMDNASPNSVPVIPFAVPCFDPSPRFRRDPQKGRVLVTMEGPTGRVVTSLVERLRDKHIIWKMRSKFLDRLKYYAEVLSGTRHKIVYSEDKDYNWAQPLVEQCAQFVEEHVNIGQLSCPNHEMIRYGVPTSIWDGKRFVGHERIERAKRFYEGKPRDYCTQNLVRFLRENLSDN